MEKYSPSDVLAAILYFFPAARFVNDKEKIQTELAKVRQKHNKLLACFLFRQHQLYPHSEILLGALSSLMPEFLQMDGDYSEYIIQKDRLKLLWQKDLRKMFSSKGEELRQIARQFCKSLKEKQP